MPNGDEINCINRLKEIDQMFENIIEMIKMPYNLNRESRCKAQDLLKELKSHLKEEVHLYTVEKNNDEISPTDKNFYIPAILDAKSHLCIKVNSLPSDKWFNDLYSAKYYINYCLYVLVHKD